MPDNTTLNPGVGGDTIRDILKGGVKAQVVIVDLGGAGAEVLMVAGQAAMAASIPVVIANNQSAVPVSINANTTSGATPFKLISAATTNATSVKSTAGKVDMVTAFNVNAAPRFLKLYNKASTPVVGTDTPVLTLLLPGGTNGAGIAIPFPEGVQFTTGIALAITANVGDSDTTAVAASEIVVNLTYK